MKYILIIALVFSTTTTFAKKKRKRPSAPADSSVNRPLSEGQWKEVHQIIDEIKVQTYQTNYKLAARVGFTQISTNTQDTVNLGPSLASLGVDFTANITDAFGLELSALHSQNGLPAADSVNGFGSYIFTLDIGPTYTIHFDATQLDDYLSLRLLYHYNTSNITLEDPSDLIFMTGYTGIAPGIERSIPLTRKLGLLAKFNLLQILSAQTTSQLGYIQTGYGFLVAGEAYYKLVLFDLPLRIGLIYQQQGYENEFDIDVKEQKGKNSYFQLSRSLFVSLTTTF